MFSDNRGVSASIKNSGVTTAPANGVVELYKKYKTKIAQIRKYNTHSVNLGQSSCIDNIFTNEVESVTLSGVIEDKASHHKPIFACFDTKHPDQAFNKPKQVQHYNFSSKNIEILLEHLKSKKDLLTDANTPLGFDEFFETFSSAVDVFCKLDKPKVTKSNAVNNPWILDSIVDAIDKKENLYDKWIASKTAPEFKPHGDIRLHKVFTDYRRCLKKIIKFQKSSYYCNKILENSESSKKIWEVINEIRGKSKKSIKPQFVVDGVRVVERRVIANKFNEYFSWLYTRRTIVRRELGRTRANSRELGRTPREFASSSPTPTLRRTPPNVRRSTPNVRRSSGEFARVRPSSRVLRRELANGSPENSFAGRNLNQRSPRTRSAANVVRRERGSSRKTFAANDNFGELVRQKLLENADYSSLSRTSSPPAN